MVQFVQMRAFTFGTRAPVIQTETHKICKNNESLTRCDIPVLLFFYLIKYPRLSSIKHYASVNLIMKKNSYVPVTCSKNNIKVFIIYCHSVTLIPCCYLGCYKFPFTISTVDGRIISIGPYLAKGLAKGLSKKCTCRNLCFLMGSSMLLSQE